MPLSEHLLAANKKLALQYEENEKKAAELLIANAELAFQNTEKEKQAAELIIAYAELAFQNNEKEKRAAELILANRELTHLNEENEKRANELTEAYRELKKAEEYLKNYVTDMEEMMFITSHKVRQPVANILGIVSIIEGFTNSPFQLKKMVVYLKKSAETLDEFIKELSTFITGMDKKPKDS